MPEPSDSDKEWTGNRERLREKETEIEKRGGPDRLSFSGPATEGHLVWDE